MKIIINIYNNIRFSHPFVFEKNILTFKIWKLHGSSYSNITVIVSLHPFIPSSSSKSMENSRVRISDLPPQLWPLIGKRLDNYIDIVRLPSVCRSWRSSLPPLNAISLLSSDLLVSHPFGHRIEAALVIRRIICGTSPLLIIELQLPLLFLVLPRAGWRRLRPQTRAKYDF